MCECVDTPALYRVSTPSGMITIRAVPTRTPIPIVEISRSRDCDREKDSGREPARKDLLRQSMFWTSWNAKEDGARNCHDDAESEKHQKTV